MPTSKSLPYISLLEVIYGHQIGESLVLQFAVTVVDDEIICQNTLKAWVFDLTQFK